MLRSLQKKEAALPAKVRDPDSWELYILKCRDGSFYTGITTDLERRFKMHQDGKASRYTRTRRPVEVLYHEKCGSRTQALVRECAVKEFSRKKKEELIASNPRKRRDAAKRKRRVTRNE